MSISQKTVSTPKQKLFILAALFTLTACGTVGGAKTVNSPKQAGLNFEKGMLDGCKSGASIIGGQITNVVYETPHAEGQESIIDKIYARAWTDGFNYCKGQIDPALTT